VDTVGGFTHQMHGAAERELTADMSVSRDSLSRWTVSPRAAIIILLLLSTAAFAARVVPIWPQVFPADGSVRLLGADPYFHL